MMTASKLTLPFLLAGSLAAQSIIHVDTLTSGNQGGDDTAAIQRAIDASPVDSILDFGSGKSYRISRTLRLLPGRTYRGASTITMSAPLGTAMLRMNYGESRAVTIDGLTLDANRTGAILQFAVGGGTDIPATGIAIRNCTLRNNGNSGEVSESAIYTPVGIHDSEIANNRFVNCTSCIHLSNPNNVRIVGNEFNGTRGGNAISIVTYNFKYPYGEQLEISRNTGRDLMRMAIEIVGGQANTKMNAPLISDNTFYSWHQNVDKDPYGISVAVGVNARILNNYVSGRYGGYGMEVGAPGSLVADNLVEGFFHGIVIQGQRNVVIKNNTMIDQHEAGLLFSNAGPNTQAHITGNLIVNPHKFGIGMSPNDYGGSVIESNTIQREGGKYPDDRSLAFIGIKVDSNPSIPVTITGNRILQTASAPPTGFDFIGLGFFGGIPASSYSNNVIRSASQEPLGTGLFFWFGAFAEGSTVAGNEFSNLASVSNGYTSPRVKARENKAIGVTKIDSNIVPLSRPGRSK